MAAVREKGRGGENDNPEEGIYQIFVLKIHA